MPKSVLLITALVFAAAGAQAQAPDSISFQGYVTDNLGQPVDSIGWSITFNLYKEGSSVWSETQTVDIEDGVFNVFLGAVTALDTVAFDQPIDLGVTLDGQPEISPRTPLAAAAFAKALPGLYTFYRENGSRRGYNVVGGNPLNVVGSGVVGATVFGGGSNTPQANSVGGHYGTVSGGRYNSADAEGSTVSGGSGNWASGFQSHIGGGEGNTASQTHAHIGGGEYNTASGGRSAIGGGGYNVASGHNSAIAGGSGNQATGHHSGVLGGVANVASGWWAATVGGIGNDADGNYSFAAGTEASAMHAGTFVWQDSTGLFYELPSDAPNQFLARASGGFKFLTEPAPGDTVGVELPAGSGTWTTLSTETSKTDFRELNARDYLDGIASLDLKVWSYRTERGVTHIGPMSEDFYATFGHGPTEKGISSVDADGVAMAGIQALYELVKEQKAEIERLRAEVASLR